MNKIEIPIQAHLQKTQAYYAGFVGPALCSATPAECGILVALAIYTDLTWLRPENWGALLCLKNWELETFLSEQSEKKIIFLRKENIGNKHVHLCNNNLEVTLWTEIGWMGWWRQCLAVLPKTQAAFWTNRYMKKYLSLPEGIILFYVFNQIFISLKIEVWISVWVFYFSGECFNPWVWIDINLSLFYPLESFQGLVSLLDQYTELNEPFCGNFLFHLADRFSSKRLTK